MRIIQNNYYPKSDWSIACKSCGILLNIDRNDIPLPTNNIYERYVALMDCPCCGKEISLMVFVALTGITEIFVRPLEPPKEDEQDGT